MKPSKPRSLSRRTALGWLGAALPVVALTGCDWMGQEPIRVGAHPWPGYEFVHLAASLGLMDTRQVRLIDTTSASANLRALASGSLEGASLTLDEVLSARADGLDLVIVAVLDVSLGADVVLARAGLNATEDLRGKRVGVEHSAVGAVMLDAMLEAAGLAVNDIVPSFVTFDQHEKALLDGAVDAVVTYEPVKSRLLQAGAVQLFSSAEVPGRILDVMVLRRDVVNQRREAVQSLVRAHFAGLQAWKTEPAKHAAFLADRLDLPLDQVASAYAELELPDAGRNRALMSGEVPQLTNTARELAELMVRAGLLQKVPPLDGMFSPEFLPRS